MAYGVYQLQASSKFYFTGTVSRLSLASALASSGITISSNKFTVNQVGDYRVDVHLALSANGEPRNFTLDLYNETTTSVVASKDGGTEMSMGGQMASATFAVNISNAAHEFSVRLRSASQSTANQILLVYGSVAIAPAAGDSGAAGVNFLSVEENVTLANAAFTDSSTSLLPANSFILGIVFKVSTALPNGRTWQAGIVGSTDLFVPAGASGAVNTAKSTLDTAAGPLNPFANGAAGTIRLTPSNADAAGGIIRVVTRYMTLAAA